MREGSSDSGKSRILTSKPASGKYVPPAEIRLWLLRGHAESRYERVQGEGMTKAVLGIIGGSGIYDLPGLENAREEAIKSPWGEPSAPVRHGTIAGLPIVFLPRHDKGHRLSPSDINYRANIDVLKRAGVTDLISLSACGSFKEELPPGTVRAGRPVSSTAPTSAKARSSARAASRMCRWRIRCRRGCASTLPPPPRPRASRSRAAAPMSASRVRNSQAMPRA
jgi:hypothetical protein